MSEKETLKKILYNQACETWKRFCEVHNELYSITCEEYIYLLNSEMQKLEDAISQKEELIVEVNNLELKRSQLIKTVEEKLGEEKITKASHLIQRFDDLNDNLLEKYNLLLIEIIERIQEQNKKNKVFLNKAIHSLNQVKKDFSGESYVETYDKKGQKQLSMK